MTEKPFRDEDVAVRGKDFCLTQEASGFRLWVRRQNVWYKDYRVTAWVVELIRQLQASQERCRKMEEAMPRPDRLRLLADWFDAEQAKRNDWTGTEVQDDLRLMADAISVLAQQEKGGGE
jgi:hypothetical protein